MPIFLEKNIKEEKLTLNHRRTQTGKKQHDKHKGLQKGQRSPHRSM